MVRDFTEGNVFEKIKSKWDTCILPSTQNSQINSKFKKNKNKRPKFSRNLNKKFKVY